MKEQFIYINKDGDKFYYSDREMTTYHREDGPAVECADGGKSWWFNGALHREDGPAIESVSGDKTWYLNGRRHREDGPAAEYTGGDKEWYLDDVYLTEAEFNERMSPVKELTLEEIADKFGVSVDKLKIKK